jgi:hypothetical protein
MDSLVPGTVRIAGASRSAPAHSRYAKIRAVISFAIASPWLLSA